ncbi:MAG: helix-turn-helix domain-containing protein, partial [Dehalococcoidia bacterium]|nr:helix-turn-helix domain-containing protein [Dehalococcoidia bacterium]
GSRRPAGRDGSPEIVYRAAVNEQRRPPPGGEAGPAVELAAPPPAAAGEWSADAVRRLRAALGLSQAALAERIGTRQQTISEWETGARAPRRMSRRLLHLVAEASGLYPTRRDEGAGFSATRDGDGAPPAAAPTPAAPDLQETAGRQ